MYDSLLSMDKTLLLFLLLLFTRITAVTAQDSLKCNQEFFADALLDQLTGSWRAGGEVMGEKVGYAFNVLWVLNHQFLEMNLTDTSAQPAYIAKVMIGYDCDKKQYVVHWLDNFGEPFSETLGFGVQKGNAIEMVFDYPEGKLVNTFSYDPKNRQWTSHAVSLNKQGKWEVFSHIELIRSGQ